MGRGEKNGNTFNVCQTPGGNEKKKYAFATRGIFFFLKFLALVTEKPHMVCRQVLHSHVYKSVEDRCKALKRRRPTRLGRGHNRWRTVVTGALSRVELSKPLEEPEWKQSVLG